MVFKMYIKLNRSSNKKQTASLRALDVKIVIMFKKKQVIQLLIEHQKLTEVFLSQPQS